MERGSYREQKHWFFKNIDFFWLIDFLYDQPRPSHLRDLLVAERLSVDRLFWSIDTKHYGSSDRFWIQKPPNLDPHLKTVPKQRETKKGQKSSNKVKPSNE